MLETERLTEAVVEDESFDLRKCKKEKLIF